jgi:hypothetical protein
VTEGLPTVRTALAAHCLVAALCLRCDHVRDLDLEALCAHLWAKLGHIRGRSNDHAGAVEAFEKATQIAPDHI